MNLIARVEKYREETGQTKADMARRFGVPEQNYNNWVYRNSLPKDYYPIAQALLTGNESVIRESPSDYLYLSDKIPVIGWGDVQTWCEEQDIYHRKDAKEWITPSFPCSRNSIYLSVIGDSMSPDYTEGEYILVDPDVQPMHGDDVVVKTPDNKFPLKRLQITPEGTYLLAVNKDHPNRKIEAPENSIICGVVTWSLKKRR